MKKLFLFLLATVVSVTTFAQTKWTIDAAHSFVNFSVKHSGISFVDGSFRKFNGEISAPKDDFTGAKVNFTVDVASVNTSVEMRDNHLKSNDFFNAEKYPQMTFESTSFKKVKGNIYALTGNLTIRDVTKSVKFDVLLGGIVKDQKGGSKAGFLATTKINRLDYNVSYDPTGMGIGKDVNITLNLQFAQAK
jgi:polyisoprenoid-binding protein YceI